MSHKPSKLGIKDLLHTQIISFTLNVGFCLRASGFKRNWKSFQHGKMLPGCCSCTINDLATDTPSSLSIQDWDLADERKTSWTAFPSSLLRLWGAMMQHQQKCGLFYTTLQTAGSFQYLHYTCDVRSLKSIRVHYEQQRKTLQQLNKSQEVDQHLEQMLTSHNSLLLQL